MIHSRALRHAKCWAPDISKELWNGIENALHNFSLTMYGSLPTKALFSLHGDEMLDVAFFHQQNVFDSLFIFK